MAIRHSWLAGSIGPFFYEDTDPVNDPDLEYDGVAAPDQAALITSGQLKVALAPTVNPHVLRFEDIGGIVGNVVGPGASTDEAVARFDGVTGKIIQNSLVTINDAGQITLLTTARVLKEAISPLDGIGKGATAPTLTRLGNTHGYAFAVNDDGYMSFEVPTNWDGSTGIDIRIHVYTNEAYAFNSAEIRFQGVWCAVPEDGSEAVDGATHTGTLDSGDINVLAVAKGMLDLSLGVIAAGSLAAHDTVFILLSRIALVAGNDPAVNPVVIHAEFEYIANKLGEAI